MTACPDPEPPSVLVVDPSPERRRIVRLSLALAGCRVREACDATEALKLLRSLVPDVLVTGVSMPGPCDGLGLCEIVRARPLARRPAVVVLTCRIDPDRLRRIEEAGASALLPQPFSPAELVSAVQGVIELPLPELLSMPGRHPTVTIAMTARAIPE